MFKKLIALALLVAAMGRIEAGEPDFQRVVPILSEHCLDCHAAQDPEANFVMETFETLMKGGESGVAIVPGKSAESLLVRMIEGTAEKDGKKKIMPPGKRAKLTTEQIAEIKAWIDAGAKAPVGTQIASKEIKVPKLMPKGMPRKSIHAIAVMPGKPIFAMARYNEIEIRSSENRTLVRTLSGSRGTINGLVFSGDGKHLFSAGGEGGLPGEVREWNVEDGILLRSYEGHKDAVYGLAISPDGKVLATGSYDQKIKLWNTESGQEIRTLSGHNGCVYALAFRPDGKILASASGDRTVKLWDVASGERRDTLSQSLKELYTVAFSPDGKRLIAGGVDNRIRMWEISEAATETSNPLLLAKFGHEGAILKLAFSPDGKMIASSADDRTVKLWRASDLEERRAFPMQSDWAPALAFSADNKELAIGRLDGGYEIYNAMTAKPAPLPKPEITRIEPRGLQRGVVSKIKLFGKNLHGVTNLNFGKEEFKILVTDSNRQDERTVLITPSADLARSAYEFSAESDHGESGKLKVYVDDIPQIASVDATNILQLPSAVWGVHAKPGDRDKYRFAARQGQTVVFDFAGKALGSKADGVLTVSDESGKVLASNNGFDGSPDPFLTYAIPATGIYAVQVSEQSMGGSAEHFYRLNLGELPYVTACYPFSLGTNTETQVELIGPNVSAKESVTVKTVGSGEIDLPFDSKKFRSRRNLKLLVSDLPQQLESEPNDAPERATFFPTPGAVAGRFWRDGNAPDSDLFAFDAKAGEKWIIETVAAQRGSPADTKIEVLDAMGKPVERVLLQAMRNSAVTFRGIDSNTTDCRVDNWEEMELNQYLYLQGEVVKLFRAPQGPDSGFLFYALNGKRHCYFDTSATTHALEEPCYIVEPHPPGTKLAANGLPTFTLTYENDDDAERKLGADSKLYFDPPRDARYLIRVSDTRGFSGERFIYRLVARKAEPDFKVRLDGVNSSIATGSGQSFTVSADRFDGFDGEIKVAISGLPSGFAASTPLIIEAGQTSAAGEIYCTLDAPEPNATNGNKTELTATALVDGKVITHQVNNFGMIKRTAKPKLFVGFEPDSTAMNAKSKDSANEPLEITMAPGEIVPAWLKIKRNGHEDLVTFTVENLPHGVIVDNIGLNGVLIPKDQNERQIFLKAAKWVPDSDRLCYAVENQAGRQTSRPLWLHVRRAHQTASVR